MGYVTQSMDTSPEVEAKQIEILRRLGPGRRVAMMRNLSRTQLRSAYQGLKRANPQLTPRELQVAAVRNWYGDEIAARLEAALKERGLWS